MKKILVVFTLFLLPLFSVENITLDYLKEQPKGIARDFYIWLFLQKDNITPKEVSEAYQLAQRKNTKLFGLYYKKGDNKRLSRATICQRMQISKLLQQDGECIASAIDIKKAESLSPKTLLNLSKKVEKNDKTLSQSLYVMAQKNPLDSLIKSDVFVFTKLYFGGGDKTRSQMNKKIPNAILVAYIKTKNESFRNLIRHSVLTTYMGNLQESLAEINPSEVVNFLDYESSFYMGMNALRFQKTNKAMEYFKRSENAIQYEFYKNRAIFWQYLLSKDSKALEKLTLSKSLDVYALAAQEMANKAPNYNIVRDIPLKETQALWDTRNPFEWERIKKGHREKKDGKHLAKVEHSNTKAHFLLLKRERNTEYFLTPYKEAFGRFDTDKQALLYALGRQESLFIPTAISTSYALGVMQLMPFNVVAIAKELNESDKVGYLDMFDPNVNVPYAEYFTRPLVKEFNHPLFISYAYNGGPGFARRLLAKNYLFKKNNPYDPWFSMEMIPYGESRLYGKRVLANYVIYQQGFGKDVKLLELLDKTLVY